MDFYKKLVLTVFITFSVVNLFAQQKYKLSDNKQEKIDAISFPYYDGYFMKFEEKRTTFDQYNFPSNVEDAFIHYTFHKFDNETIKIYYSDLIDGDTVKMQTFLTLNADGMSWWLDDDSLDVVEKHKTLAISLPLYKDKEWKTHFNDLKVNARCITTDTVITTKFGELKAFGIEFQFKPTKEGGMKFYQMVQEFYVQDIGKVYSIYAVYYYHPETKKKFRAFSSESFITDYKR